jgi:drug/metabolite transporter (DMT)-like permease
MENKWSTCGEIEPSETSNWTGGLFLILLGIGLLLQNYGKYSFGNWWAIFILFFASSSIAKVWNSYRQKGFTLEMAGPALWILSVLMVALILLMELDWGKTWPIFLVPIGAKIFIGTRTRRQLE